MKKFIPICILALTLGCPGTLAADAEPKKGTDVGVLSHEKIILGGDDRQCGYSFGKRAVPAGEGTAWVRKEFWLVHVGKFAPACPGTITRSTVEFFVQIAQSPPWGR